MKSGIPKCTFKMLLLAREIWPFEMVEIDNDWVEASRQRASHFHLICNLANEYLNI